MNLFDKTNDELDRLCAEKLGQSYLDEYMADRFHPTTNGQQAMELLREYRILLEPDKSGEWHAKAPAKLGNWFTPEEFISECEVMADDPRTAIVMAVIAMGEQE